MSNTIVIRDHCFQTLTCTIVCTVFPYIVLSMNRNQLFELAGDKPKALTYLQSIGLIRKRCDCPICHQDMAIVRQLNRATMFRCPNRCKPGGNKGLLSDSFFARKKLSPDLILIVIYCWANGDSYRKIFHETRRGESRAGNGKPIITSSRTICSMGRLLGALVKDHIQSGWERERIGGRKIKVQIDESHFGRAKGEKGRHITERWVLGMISDGSDDFRVVVLTGGNRDAFVLTSQICDHVLPGSHLITDKWKGYVTETLKEKGYKHKSINHSDKKHPFVAPDGTNTQRIESMWSDMKSKWRRHTIRDQYFEEWVFVYLWRRRCIAQGKSLFEDLLSIIRNKYPIPGNQH